MSIHDTAYPTILLVGIGGLAGAGKDTLATALRKELLETHRITSGTLHMATALKAMAKHTFGWDGKKDEKGRRFLQLLGTDIARAYDDNYWIRWHKTAVQDYFRSRCSVLFVPDIRFPNEVRYIRDSGGILLWVERPGHAGLSGGTAAHASETSVMSDDFDDVVVNSGPIEATASMVVVRKILRKLGREEHDDNL